VGPLARRAGSAIRRQAGPGGGRCWARRQAERCAELEQGVERRPVVPEQQLGAVPQRERLYLQWW